MLRLASYDWRCVRLVCPTRSSVLICPMQPRYVGIPGRGSTTIPPSCLHSGLVKIDYYFHLKRTKKKTLAKLTSLMFSPISVKNCLCSIVNVVLSGSKIVVFVCKFLPSNLVTSYNHASALSAHVVCDVRWSWSLCQTFNYIFREKKMKNKYWLVLEIIRIKYHYVITTKRINARISS